MIFDITAGSENLEQMQLKKPSMSGFLKFVLGRDEVQVGVLGACEVGCMS